MRVLAVASTLLILLAPRIEAQRPLSPREIGRPATSDDSVALTITSAEARGSRHSSGAPTDSISTASFRAEIGTGERRCVAVGSAQYARSGDFVVGPFADYPSVWRGGYGKLAWQLFHAHADAPLHLVLQATRLDADATPYVFDAERVFSNMYAGNFHLPTAGRWMLVGISGSAWGCFVFDVR